MAKKLTVASLIMLIGGAVTLLASFLPFYDQNGFSRNAWSKDAGAFVSTIPAILALAMVVWIVLGLAGVKTPEKVLTYNSDQLKGTWGIAAAGLMIAYFTVDSVDKGIGFYLMTLGSLAMGVGAVLALLGLADQVLGAGGAGGGASGQASYGAAPPPPPGGYGAAPPPQGGYGAPPPPPGGGAPPPPPPAG